MLLGSSICNVVVRQLKNLILYAKILLYAGSYQRASMSVLTLTIDSEYVHFPASPTMFQVRESGHDGENYRSWKVHYVIIKLHMTLMRSDWQRSTSAIDPPLLQTTLATQGVKEAP